MNKIDKKEYYRDVHDNWTKMMLEIARNKDFEKLGKMAHSVVSVLGDLQSIYVRDAKVQIDTQFAMFHIVSWTYRYPTRVEKYQYLIENVEIVDFLKEWTRLYFHRTKRAAFCSICGAPVDPITAQSAFPVRTVRTDDVYRTPNYSCSFCEREVRSIVSQDLSRYSADQWVRFRKQIVDYDASQIIYKILTLRKKD